MKIKLGGKWWRRRVVNYLIHRGELRDGDCRYDQKEIRISRLQTPREEMETDIHESLHAMFPWLREWMVDICGKELTILLYDKLGYRRQIK
jgi:hypothetical protein